ncbi:hypothetical protein MKZ38_008286 [Zalerion maritima]|uniref:Linalool dehydratase/isomerase domain-containing protein n=1 Tax=Zalerion maritima TaxID=339359 RepID=A0AAD5WP81_9PEZI|nr:hypothetical protein MKZ38_008286 [Zalerion maritima]
MGNRANGQATTNGVSNGKLPGEYVRELIPPNVGQAAHRHLVQARTLAVWIAVAAVGVFLLYGSVVDMGPKGRAAALTLVFPGAGYIAAANLVSALLLVLTWALMPLALFAWFGAGAISFPLAVWVSSIFGAHLSTGNSVWDRAGLWTPAILSAAFALLNRMSNGERSAGNEKRESRNAFIAQELARVDQQVAQNSPPRNDRELDLQGLRLIQFLIDQAFQDINDWSGFTRIDQFQTSALRYQLYEMMYCLGLYQGTYAPNAHGCLNEALHRVVDKSLTPTAMNFWKWETLFGRLSTDFDPVVRGNTMVTGFLLQGLMLYTANTGDERYTRPGSLKFRVTDTLSHDYDLHTMREAMVKQWKENPYCMFPCEPNWIYTPCNFQGATGSIIYDRCFGTRDVDIVMPILGESLNRNFTDPSGSVVPIRSELTGFTIPGLVGADKMDPGNYRSNDRAMYPHLAQAAGEFGGDSLRRAALEKVVGGFGIVTTATGGKSLDLAKASTTMNYSYVRAALMRANDWRNVGPSETTLAGPILSSIPYPGVLVAKACSHDSQDLDLVLYPSSDNGTFTIGVSRLRPGKSYIVGDKTVTDDSHGEVSCPVLVSGRTQVHLVPAERDPVS